MLKSFFSFRAMEFVQKILNRRAYHQSGKLPFSEVQIGELLRNFTEITVDEPPVLTLTGEFCVVGDMHGDLDSLLRIFGAKGYPPMRSYVFLGDYVDRGKFSCEVLLFLYALKVMFPQHVYLLRGNHEFAQMSTVYGFQKECQAKLSQRVFEAFCETFDTLPIVALIGGNFCTHGGISGDVRTLDDLFTLSKPSQMTSELESFAREMDLLWSDPEFDVDDFEESPRGLGHLFGVVQATDFLKSCGMKRIIRAHQACYNGYDWVFEDDGPVVTIFSACDYNDMMNDAAVMVVSSENNSYDITTFRPLTGKKLQMYQVPWPAWALEIPQPIVCSLDLSLPQLITAF